MIRGGQQRRWHLIGLWLAAALLAGCAARKAALEEPPPSKDAKGEPLGPDQEPLPEIEVGAEQTTIEIRDPQGQVVWSVDGKLRSTVSGETGTIELFDIRATSELPGYEATLTAGRLRYRLGDDFLLVDRRIFVGAPQRQADLEAESAQYLFPAKQFVVTKPARVRVPEAVLEASTVIAALDLRSVTFTEPTAHERSATPAWQLTAQNGLVDAAGVAGFEVVTGSLIQNGVITTFGAPRAAWKPGPKWLNFNDGAELQRDGFTLSAAALTWRQADHKVVTRGATTMVRGGLRVTGSGGTVDVANRTGHLENIVVTGPQLTMRAATGDVTSEGTVRLSSLRGTVDGQTAVSAPSALYYPDAQRLILPSGGTASRAGATVRAGHVVYEGGAKRFTATGGVRLVDSQGTITGDRLSGPADLSTATLTPVTATGQQDGQRWRLQAGSGTWSRGGVVALTKTTARIDYRGRQVHATAGTVRYEPGAARLVFEGGFRAESPADSVVVTSQRAVYSLATRNFRASGNVSAKARGIAVKNAGEWTYHVGADAGESLLSSGKAQPAKPAARPPKKEPAKPPANPDKPVDAPAGEVADEGATGTGDRPSQGDDQGPELSGPDAGDARTAGG